METPKSAPRKRKHVAKASKRLGGSTASVAAAELKSIGPAVPIIGFTGALGSGCSYLARGLAESRDFAYCSLSEPIHEEIKKLGLQPTSEVLQDTGDRLRAEHNDPAYLAKVMLQRVDKRLQDDGKKARLLIVDGIRNTAEVAQLRAWPHFYLFSVQADHDLRMQRVLATGDRVKGAREFDMADARDADEQSEFGQQVRKCNHIADVIVLNEETIPPNAVLKKRQYISQKFESYVSLITLLAEGAVGVVPPELRPTIDESLMMAAYVQSKRSLCVKRKVGAVISSKEGEIIAAGYNDVPEGSLACIEDPSLGWCARDRLQEEFGQRLKYCPSCGKKVRIKTVCKFCQSQITSFLKRCPKCNAELPMDYPCPNRTCKEQLFRRFVPGADPKTGKLLDMCRSLHAEENAILSLSKSGLRLPGEAMLYCTTFPCNLCANKIVSMGIRTVVFAEPYPMKEAHKIFVDKGVILRRFEGVKSNAFFRFFA